MSARGRLFALSLALVVAAVAVVGAVASAEIRTLMSARIESELSADARAAAAFISDVDTPAEMDAAVDALGAAVRARITVINSDGVVWADSELNGTEIAALENHGDRTEVLAALASGAGIVRRFSSTLHTDMLYVALPCTLRSGTGVVRASMPLSSVDTALARVRTLLLFAVGIGVLLAVVMSFVAAELFTRSLRALVRRTAWPSGSAVDEVGALAGTFRRMSSELEHSVASLALERDRFAAVLQAMQDAVLALDHDGQVQLVNPAAMSLLGLDESPRGKRLVELVRSVPLNEAIGRARGASSTCEITLAPDRRVEAYAAATHEGTLLVLRDISELRRLESVRRDFVANVSHELRTPIAVIAANAETLLLGALHDPTRALTFVRGIERNAERLSRLIADLLDIARIESGRIDFDSEPQRLAALAARVQLALAAAVTDKNHTLKVDIEPTLLALGDARALEQVLTNLVDNAVKYTPTGGQITVAARSRGDVVLLEVTDDGPGIAAPHRTRVFERFYRVDAGRSREVGGTGLGLGIVKHLVEAMGGSVSVHDVLPHGARFTVTLRTCHANDTEAG